MNRNEPSSSRFLRAGAIALLPLFLIDTALSQQVVSTPAELVAAVAAANSGAASSEIVLQNGTYVLGSQLWLRTAGTTVRGQSGSPGAVVVEGAGMTSGITHAFQVAAHDVTISDLTIRDFSNHAVQIHGEGPWSADRTVLRNLVIQDTGQQMVKVSYAQGTAPSADDGVVEDCLFEYTAGIGPQYYIGGVDAHQAQNWIVRGCTFRGIRSPGSNVAEHAVHFWSDSGGTLVERNVIVNCDRGIGFGLGNRGHSGGIIRNNMIYHADLGADRGDVGIELESASGAEVYNNTVLLEHAAPAAIAVRFGASSVTVTNNLLAANGSGHVVWRRDGANLVTQANLTSAQASWFVDPPSGDLHLASPVPSVVDQGVPVPGLSDDFDGETRSTGPAPDLGADELVSLGTGGSGGSGGSGGGNLQALSWGAGKARYR